MHCKICQEEFNPNKYHPHQQVCFKMECQRLRQIQNEKEWRTRNPEYFKYLGQEGAWREKRQRYNKLWKITHKDALKGYEERHNIQHREYMREYMRKYREAKNVNRDKS